MKKLFIYAVYAILGYGLLLMTIYISTNAGHSEFNWGFILKVVLPVFFITASVFLGYFCQPFVHRHSVFILLSLLFPGLYCSISAIVITKGVEFLADRSEVLAVVILMSFAIVGVYLGKYLRAKQII